MQFIYICALHALKCSCDRQRRKGIVHITTTLSSNGHKKLKKLVNIKIVNFKKGNRDPEKLPKQGEDSESL